MSDTSTPPPNDPIAELYETLQGISNPATLNQKLPEALAAIRTTPGLIITTEAQAIGGFTPT